MTYKKKLIEVALPLDAINAESAREKSIRHGHPSTLHLWWARRPLAACRAVLFAQLVDDPSAHPDRFPTDEAQEAERQRLFRIIEQLVKWENSNNPEVLEAARAEIRACFDGEPPAILDPFAGGGSIPLEAQRLGLEAHASDLNPVAVLINKALIEIPPRWAGRPPVHPVEGRLDTRSWTGAQGLADDVRYYGQWMRDAAEQRIGHLYPKAKLPDGSEATVIAWIWARTVTCPNPACRATMPLVSTFWLGKKKGKEAWVKPIIEGKDVRFEIGHGPAGPPDPPKTGRGAKFRCLVCGEQAPDEHVKAEGRGGRMGAQLMAVVAEGQRQRVYLPATDEHEQAARVSRPDDLPDGAMPENPRWFSPPAYGMTEYVDLFTNRQLVALTTFSDLVAEARTRITADACAAGLPPQEATDYATAVATYLGFMVSVIADDSSSLCAWRPSHGTGAARNTFARQALPMVWDFTEVNPFGRSAGDPATTVVSIARVLDQLLGRQPGHVQAGDATGLVSDQELVLSTDPPYYDNIGYADLADFFYVWLRRSLRSTHPEIFATLLTPKTEELVATPYRFEGNKAKAKEFFEEGFSSAFSQIRKYHRSDIPMSIFYAFKQAEDDKVDGTASTGWETLLEGLVQSGWSVTATWPMRTEKAGRAVGIGTNALASSVVLACRPRSGSAGISDRRSFLSTLKAELPDAVRTLQCESIAPVDLAQAAIGPGMAVFTRYAKVLEPDGSPMRVRTALGLINQVLAEVLDEQEGDFDPDTRWAIKWFDQVGMDEGPSGLAEQLCTTYNVSLRGLEHGGIITLAKGKTRLCDRDELPDDWDPVTDDDVSVWEATQHLARRLTEQGESAAADLLRRLGGYGDAVRELAYLLFAMCERRKRSKEALAYNALVTSWPEIARLAAGASESTTQGSLL